MESPTVDKYLLDSGLVPCTDSGKKTRKYKIEMPNVIRYLEERDLDPEKFKAPVGWYRKDYNPDEAIHKTRSLTEKQKQKLRIQYLKKMKSYPDVLKTKDIAIIIGYNRNSVSKWCIRGVLKCIDMGNHYLVSKEYLLDFMLSPDFRGLKEGAK